MYVTIVTLIIKKVNIFYQKGVDKIKNVCYTIQAIKSGHIRGVANSAGVAKLADARDLKSRGARAPYGFDSRSRHHLNYQYRGVEQPGSSSGS